MKRVLGRIQEVFSKKNEPEVIILMDIDGVLSFEGSPTDEAFIVISNGWGRWRIRYEVLEWLKKLASDKKVEIMWLSTWGSDSNIINQYLAIPDFKAIGKSEGMAVKTKIKQILNVVQELEDKTVIVVDDALGVKSSDMSMSENTALVKLWDRLTSVCHKNKITTQFVVPDVWTGIVKEEMKFVDDVIESVKFEKE